MKIRGPHGYPTYLLEGPRAVCLFLIYFRTYLSILGLFLFVFEVHITPLIVLCLLCAVSSTATWCKFWISPAPMRGVGMPARCQLELILEIWWGAATIVSIILAGRSAGIENRDGLERMYQFLGHQYLIPSPSWFWLRASYIFDEWGRSSICLSIPLTKWGLWELWLPSDDDEEWD